MTRGHEWVPDFLARSTKGNFEDGLHEIDDQIAPDAEMSPDVDEHVAFPGWGKNAKILEQDGEFDEEDREAIDNRCDIDPLDSLSVLIRNHWTLKIIECISRKAC